MNLQELPSLETGLETQIIPDFPQETKDKKSNGKKKPGFWDKVFRRRMLERPNMVAVLYLRNNGTAVPMELEPRNGFFSIGTKNYNEDRDCVYSMGKHRTPLCIIPEWSMIPYGTQKWHDKDMLEKFHELEDHALKGIRHAELVKMGGGESFKWNAKAIIGIGILVIVGGAILVNYL